MTTAAEPPAGSGGVPIAAGSGLQRADPVTVVLVTAAAYALVALPALGLAAQSSYASPLFPAAGVALAAALVYGWPAVLGVCLGSTLSNTALGWVLGLPWWGVALLPWPIGVGAALQAAAGAALIRRGVPQPLTLDAPRDIGLAGLLGAGVACLISASVATVVLWASQVIPSPAVAGNWLTWWLGDAMGVLIGLPLALALIGQPREDWRPRLRTVGLPLLGALLLLGAAIVEWRGAETERLQTAFERDSQRLAGAMQQRLAEPLHALQALHSLALTRTDMDSPALRDGARWWLAQGMHLQALGYSQRVPLAQLGAFEAGARAQGLPGYTVFDRDGGRARRVDGEVMALRLIEPLAGNQGALGVNALSIPAARAAIEASRDSGEPAATAGFGLTQSTSDDTGVVIYQALYRAPAAALRDSEARRKALRGVVFVTVNADRMLSRMPDTTLLDWCLVDADPRAERQRLAGPRDCDHRNDADFRFADQHALSLAGRPLLLKVRAPLASVPGRAGATPWLVSTVGLAAVALLGALLLTITGQSRRTERSVQTATADLRHEMAVRNQAEAALRDSEGRLRSILDHLPVGVMFLQPDGKVLDCNPRLCELLGRPADNLRGQGILALVPHDEQAPLLRQRRELMRGHEMTTAGPLRMLHGSGGERHVRISASALRGADGRVWRIVAAVEDVSESLRLQASESALQRAQATNQAQREFMSRMSHELRTPLNAMIGFNQLLDLQAAEVLSPQQRGWVQQSLRAGWHLLEMINETLDLARIESGAVQLTLSPVPLAPLLTGCQAMLAGAALQQDVTVSTALDPRAGTVLGDATRLTQVLSNLLSNAIKYNRPGGTVQLRSRPAGETEVELQVSDTGQGMTREQLAGLFQPYNRLGREQGPVQGTGIGLVITRRLVELMGGTLTVDSVAGSGSTFTLRLPAASVPETTSAAPAAAALPSYRRRRVHYIEDNETNIEVMRGLLLQRPQVELTVSMLGLDGLTAVRQRRPDLVLLDMQLPDISGLELLRHLMRDVQLADIPVVIVSADATPVHIEEALKLGAVSYITKPVSVSRFLAVLDGLLEAVDTRL